MLPLLLLFQIVYSYNETVSLQSAYLFHLTYCEITACKNCEIDYIVENEGSMAIQGYDYISDSIFTAFRGSSNVHNWIEDIQVNHDAPYSDPTIMVENGFYKEYRYIKSELFENLDNLSRVYGTNELLLTGHSLGSAACTLFAYDIVDLSVYKIRNFYNFGSPRVGNAAFVEDFNNKIIGYRVVHANDIVATAPPILFDYAHIATGICYDENNTMYEICPDISCAKYCSSEDHLNYLNISMGSSGC